MLKDVKKKQKYEAPELINLGELFCIHSGQSMNPVLLESDLLEVVPYYERKIHICDVIFFKPPKREYPVIHRITHINQEGIYTRGDNNNTDDLWSLHSVNIIGQVVATWRKQKRRKVVGGWVGWMVAQLMYWKNPLSRRLSLLMYPIYNSLAHYGIMHYLLPTQLKPRVIVFKVNGCCYLRLLLGNRVVGQYNTNHHQWHIKRPFRLFVNEKVLPLLKNIK